MLQIVKRVIDVAGTPKTVTLRAEASATPKGDGTQDLRSRVEALARLRVLDAHVAPPELGHVPSDIQLGEFWRCRVAPDL